MKQLALLLFLPALAYAAPELTGIATMEHDRKVFNLREAGDKATSEWVSLGDTFSGYTLKSYDGDSETLTLVKDQEVLALHLSAAPKAPPPAAADKPLDQLSDDELAQRGYARIAAGDTGTKIARKSGLTIQQLNELNPGIDWRRLKIGQILRTKANAAPPPEARQERRR